MSLFSDPVGPVQAAVQNYTIPTYEVQPAAPSVEQQLGWNRAANQAVFDTNEARNALTQNTALADAKRKMDLAGLARQYMTSNGEGVARYGGAGLALSPGQTGRFAVAQRDAQAGDAAGIQGKYAEQLAQYQNALNRAQNNQIQTIAQNAEDRAIVGADHRVLLPGATY